MPLNLNALAGAAHKPLIEPRDIFTALSKRPWPRLRVEQDQVLKAWFARRAQERDLVIKQNTGGGKTVVGLLAAQSSLNEGISPAAYLVPDTYLVKQVVDEARRLGLKVTTDHKGAEFLSGNAILVCTFEKVVNGRSWFGLADSYQPRTIGTLVVDDAHAALAAARRQFTVSVPPTHAAFAKAHELFGEELVRQSPKNGRALLAGDRSASLRIPFWLWSAKGQAVVDAIAATADDDSFPGIYFSWPLLADFWPQAMALISDRGLLLRTPCPAIKQIPAFHRAKRRIYLTATLADDGVLVTELGADPGSVRTPITPERATDLGDRVILAPAALNPQIADDQVRRLARQFANGDRDGDGNPEADPVNVVVLVPSDRAAEVWRPIADQVVHVGDMKPVIDRMIGGAHIGLLVLVNKYDGVDLPRGACRLLVIDGIPTPLDLGEQREAAALAGSNEMRIRKVQRLEQGMGRGIRDAEDFCAVLLLGDDVARSLIDKADLEHFSPATRAQIDLSRQVAAQIAGEGLAPIRELLDLFIRRDQGWRNLSSQAIAGVEYEHAGHVGRVSEARRRAWELASAGDPAQAAKVLQEALTDVDEIERGWRLEEVAGYRHQVDAAEAQTLLRAAKQLNSTVILPSTPIASKPSVGTERQAERVVEYLERHYESGASLQLAMQAFLDALCFSADPDLVDGAEDATKALGLHLGLQASRPEKETGSGPDVCWGLTPASNAVFELKTNTTRPDAAIIKTEADQLSGSVSWNTDSGGPDACIPVLIARSSATKPDAKLPPGARVVTPETLDQLKQQVRNFVSSIAAAERWHDSPTVEEALRAHHLTADRLITKHSVRPSK